MPPTFVLNQIYRIEMRNRSGEVIQPCFYWTIPGDQSMSSIAWRAAAAAHTTRIGGEFQYTLGFFVSPGAPHAGAMIRAHQCTSIPLSFASNNGVHVSYAATRSEYAFGTPNPYSLPGKVYLLQDNMGRADAGVGISIGGVPALVTAAKSATMLTIPTELQLNVGFLATKCGTIIDLSQVQQPTPIDFPENIYEMYANVGKKSALEVTEQSYLHVHRFLDVDG